MNIVLKAMARNWAGLAPVIHRFVDNPREYYRVQQILRDRADLLSEVERLTEALHYANCVVELAMKHRNVGDCSCGLWAALSGEPTA